MGTWVAPLRRMTPLQPSFDSQSSVWLLDGQVPDLETSFRQISFSAELGFDTHWRTW